VADLQLPPPQLFPTFGGMNIAHGLPDNPVTFWSVCIFSVGEYCSAGTWVVLFILQLGMHDVRPLPMNQVANRRAHNTMMKACVCECMSSNQCMLCLHHLERSGGRGPVPSVHLDVQGGVEAAHQR
jgi:hypothetical protein